jgi:hypothetical protein
VQFDTIGLMPFLLLAVAPFDPRPHPGMFVGRVVVQDQVQRQFYERACQEKTSPTASANAIVIGSLPLLRRELPPISLGAPAFLSLRAARGRCGPLAESGYFSFRSLPLGSRPETSSLLRDGFLAEVIALQLANHGSIGGSRPTAISGHTRGPIVRQGSWGQPRTPPRLRLSLDLLQFRFQ